MTAEQAEKAYADLHKSGELSDSELDNVAGGCEEEVPPQKFQIDDRVMVNLFKWGNPHSGTITGYLGYVRYDNDSNDHNYDVEFDQPYEYRASTAYERWIKKL